MTEPTDNAPMPERPAAAEEPAAPLPVSEEPPVSKPPRQITGWLALLLALLTLALAAAGGYYLWQQQQQLQAVQQTLASRADLQAQTEQLAQGERRLREEVQALRQSNAAAASSTGEIQQRMDALSEAQEALQQRFAKLDVETQARQGEWVRAEAVYLARLAIARATLQRDVDGALAALKLADELLAQLNSRAISERQALHRAINQLVAVDLPDISQLAGRIEELINRVDVLPLAQQLEEARQRQQPGAPPAPPPAQDDWQARLQRGWQRLKDTLGQLVIVQRGQPTEPLLAPEERYFLYHNLRLRLESARLALLEGEADLYQRSLARAGEWMERYYASGEPGVEQALKEIAALRAVDIQPELPPLAQLLEPVTGH